MLTCCNGLLEFCDVHNAIMVKNQTCFIIWFLHGSLQSCYFVSIEFPKSNKLGHVNFFYSCTEVFNRRNFAVRKHPQTTHVGYFDQGPPCFCCLLHAAVRINSITTVLNILEEFEWGLGTRPLCVPHPLAAPSY